MSIATFTTLSFNINHAHFFCLLDDIKEKTHFLAFLMSICACRVLGVDRDPLITERLFSITLKMNFVLKIPI